MPGVNNARQYWQTDNSGNLIFVCENAYEVYTIHAGFAKNLLSRDEFSGDLRIFEIFRNYFWMKSTPGTLFTRYTLFARFDFIQFRPLLHDFTRFISICTIFLFYAFQVFLSLNLETIRISKNIEYSYLFEIAFVWFYTTV